MDCWRLRGLAQDVGCFGNVVVVNKVHARRAGDVEGRTKHKVGRNWEEEAGLGRECYALDLASQQWHCTGE